MDNEVKNIAGISEEIKSYIEALLFASDEPVSLKTLNEVLNDFLKMGSKESTEDVKSDIIKQNILSLNNKYKENSQAFHIIEIAGGYQYATLPKFAKCLGYLFKEKAKRRLSQSALETLAIVAFKQPISKPDIEGIRGVNSDYVISTLLEKNLISITGRAETVGRPLLYGTTKDFLQHFGLKDINDLPKLKEVEEIMNSEEFKTEVKKLEDSLLQKEEEVEEDQEETSTEPSEQLAEIISGEAPELKTDDRNVPQVVEEIPEQLPVTEEVIESKSENEIEEITTEEPIEELVEKMIDDQSPKEIELDEEETEDFDKTIESELPKLEPEGAEELLDYRIESPNEIEVIEQYPLSEPDQPESLEKVEEISSFEIPSESDEVSHPEIKDDLTEKKNEFLEESPEKKTPDITEPPIFFPRSIFFKDDISEQLIESTETQDVSPEITKNITPEESEEEIIEFAPELLEDVVSNITIDQSTIPKIETEEEVIADFNSMVESEASKTSTNELIDSLEKSIEKPTEIIEEAQEVVSYEIPQEKADEFSEKLDKEFTFIEEEVKSEIKEIIAEEPPALIKETVEGDIKDFNEIVESEVEKVSEVIPEQSEIIEEEPEVVSYEIPQEKANEFSEKLDKEFTFVEEEVKSEIKEIIAEEPPALIKETVEDDIKDFNEIVESEVEKVAEPIPEQSEIIEETQEVVSYEIPQEKADEFSVKLDKEFTFVEEEVKSEIKEIIAEEPPALIKETVEDDIKDFNEIVESEVEKVAEPIPEQSEIIEETQEVVSYEIPQEKADEFSVKLDKEFTFVEEEVKSEIKEIIAEEPPALIKETVEDDIKDFNEIVESEVNKTIITQVEILSDENHLVKPPKEKIFAKNRRKEKKPKESKPTFIERMIQPKADRPSIDLKQREEKQKQKDEENKQKQIRKKEFKEKKKSEQQIKRNKLLERKLKYEEQRKLIDVGKIEIPKHKIESVVSESNMINKNHKTIKIKPKVRIFEKIKIRIKIYLNKFGNLFKFLKRK